MVAKIISGKRIKGALNYNEKKVNEGKAVLLNAVEFPAMDLSFDAKLNRFFLLTEQNLRAKTNAVHISLNFDPSENLGKETLCAIAEDYINRIGFEGQPYLLYEHLDAAHQHLHIVTTNIKSGGKRIPLHYIGENQSEKARKEIEKQFGLIPAESKNRQQQDSIKPITEKVIYGKSETKAAISNVVRAVTSDYKFASLAELNAVLGLYNVTAYRGEEGSKMFEKKGLTYSVTGADGNKVGVPIKASSIYTKPTLANLEKKFAENKNRKSSYKEPLKNTVDKILNNGFIPDKEALKNALKKQNIDVVFRQNETMVYGITYIDHRSKTVFNGSDLGKEYSAKRIMERIGVSGIQEQQQKDKNRDFVGKLLKETDYTKGVPSALAAMYAKGLRVRTEANGNGETDYYLGKKTAKEETFHKADRKLSAWFVHNNITPNIIDKLNAATKQHTSEMPSVYQDNGHSSDLLVNLIATLLEAEQIAPTIGGEPPKKKKRKPNR